VIVRFSNQDHRASVLVIVHSFRHRADFLSQIVEAPNSILAFRRLDDHGGPLLKRY
jgi:hypothetical protein